MSYQSTILADSPIGLWPLSETIGTVANDLGSGGNDGVINGTPVLAKTGLVFESGGVCPIFDGANDGVLVSASLFAAGNTGSIECWVMPTGFPNANHYFIDCADISIPSTNRFVLRCTGSQITIYYSGVSYSSGYSLSVNNIYHLVATANGNKLRLYVNGNLVYSVTASGTPNFSLLDRVSIGEHYDGTQNHQGKIQYPAVYNYTLTHLKIRQHYQAGIATGLHKEILDLSPEFYYPFNEVSGDPKDWSNNDRGSVLGSNISQGLDGGLAYDSSTANSFAASHTTVEVTALPSFSNTLTFGCLVKSTQNSTDKYLFDANPSRFTFFWNSTTSGTMGVYSGAASDDFGSAPADDEWHFVIIICNGTSADCYIDGVQLGTTQTITAIDLSSVTDMNIGGRYGATGASAFVGGIQCAFLTSNAITYAQVRKLSIAARTLIENRGFPKIIANLSPDYYARLGEASGTIIYDESGNNYDGSIVGSAVLGTNQGPLHQSALKSIGFDGSSVHIQSTYAGQSGSQNRTFLCLFKMPTVTGAKRVIASYGTNTSNQLFEVHVDTNGNFGVDYNGCSAIGDTVISTSQFIFGAIVLNGTTCNDTSIYINGIVETESYTNGTNTINTVAGTDLRIGVSITGSNYAEMDAAEVIEISSALTAQQIKQIYKSINSRVTAEIISKQSTRNLFDFSEISGNLIDYGDLGNDGIWTGSPTYQQTPPVVTNDTADKAIAITASEEVAITSDIASNTYSLMVFAKPTAVSGTQKLFDDGGADGFRLNGSKMSLFFSATEHNSDTTLVAGEPHMFAVSVSSGVVSFNLDGGNDGSASGAPLINPDVLFDSSFVGDVDAAAIFNTALSDQDWLDIYEMASFVTISNLTYKIKGVITESLAQDKWIARAFKRDTGEFVVEQLFTGLFYTLETDPYNGNVDVAIIPNLGLEWKPSTSISLGDRTYPTNCKIYNYYFECTTSGTTGSSEPIWPSSGTINDGTVVWTWKGALTRPVMHGPLKPIIQA